MTSSARRALRILEIVNSSPEPMGVTAIAGAADTLPGTAFRSLDALERCEFVSRYRASTQYQVGAATRRLKHTLYAQFPLRNVILPFLRRLAYASSHTVTLTVPVGWHALRLAVVAGSSPVRSATTTGVIGPLDADFAGLAILSTFDDAMRVRFQAEAPGKRIASLKTVLEEIAHRGYAVGAADVGATHAAIAFPVRRNGRAVAAIAIEGPVVDVESGAPPEELAEWQAILAEVEAHIAQLGSSIDGPFAHIDPAVVTRALSAQSAGQ